MNNETLIILIVILNFIFSILIAYWASSGVQVNLDIVKESFNDFRQDISYDIQQIKDQANKNIEIANRNDTRNAEHTDKLAQHLGLKFESKTETKSGYVKITKK